MCYGKKYSYCNYFDYSIVQHMHDVYITYATDVWFFSVK